MSETPRTDAYMTSLVGTARGNARALAMVDFARQLERELAAADAELFPLLGESGFVPMRIVLPHERQAQLNHGQSVRELAKRGGLDPRELAAVLEDHRYEHVTREQAAAIIRAAIAQAKPEQEGK